MSEQKTPPLTNNSNLQQHSNPNTKNKQCFFKIIIYIFISLLLIYGIIHIPTSVEFLKNAPFPFDFPTLRIATFILLIIILIIYIGFIFSQIKPKSISFIYFIINNLEYSFLPAGFTFTAISLLPLPDAKYINDILAYLSAFAGLSTFFQNPKYITYNDPHARYYIALNNLKSDNVHVRQGAVYTLIELADSWISDDTLSKKRQHKTGQEIINHLCYYIRTPYDYISKDNSELSEEKNIRQVILHEIKARLSSGTTDIKEGPWSNFTYDFSNAHIFYTFDLSNSFLGADTKFSGTHFLCDTYFNGTTFKNQANFSDTVFQGPAEFKNAIFEDIAYFWKAEFKELANFEGVQFKSTQGILTDGIRPSDSRYLKYKSSADFRQAIFEQTAKFGKAEFNGSADFREAWFKTRSPFFHILGTLKIYARFSQIASRSDYIFNKLHNESRPISTEIKTHEIRVQFPRKSNKYLSGIRCFDIPVGCELFVPKPLPVPKPEEPTE